MADEPEASGINVEEFIGSIFMKPELWDQTSAKYRNRVLVDRGWRALSEEFAMPGKWIFYSKQQTKAKIPENSDSDLLFWLSANELRKKWKSLRDTYGRELKKQPVSRSGDAGDKAIGSTWPYFICMQFLKHQMKPRKATGNLNAPSRSQATPSQNDEPLEYDDIEVLEEGEGSEEGWFEVADTQADTSMPGCSQSPNPPPTKKPKRTTERNEQATRLLEIESRKLELLEKKTENRDEDVAFFESLLPHVRKLEGVKKLQLRMQIQQLVVDYAYDESGVF